MNMTLSLRQQRHRGFSLLELAIVITIVAMIAGAGMTVAGNALKAADRISTQEKLNVIKLAIDSYAKTYGYLPCPFDRANVPTAATFGVELRASIAGAAPNQFSNCGADNSPSFKNGSNIVVGGVPVRSLGLPDSYAGDAWGNKFTYTITAAMAAEPSRWSTKAGLLDIRFGNISTYYRMSTLRKTAATAFTYTNANDGSGNANLSFFNTTPAATSLTAGTLIHLKSNVAGGYNGSYFVKTTGVTSLVTSDPALSTNLAYNGTDTGGTIDYQDTTGGNAVAYTVFSHGPNSLGAYPMNSASVAKACSGSTIDVTNCGNGSTFYDTDYNDEGIAAQYFDDYIVWGSNEGARTAVNNSIYTTTTTKTCPTGVCEPWCAVCKKNYPGAAEAAIPPATVLNTADTSVARILCKKVITSNSTDCEASCFWSGQNSTNGYYKCP